MRRTRRVLGTARSAFVAIAARAAPASSRSATRGPGPEAMAAGPLSGPPRLRSSACGDTCRLLPSSSGRRGNLRAPLQAPVRRSGPRGRRISSPQARCEAGNPPNAASPAMSPTRDRPHTVEAGPGARKIKPPSVGTGYGLSSRTNPHCPRPDRERGFERSTCVEPGGGGTAPISLSAATATLRQRPGLSRSFELSPYAGKRLAIGNANSLIHGSIPDRRGMSFIPEARRPFRSRIRCPGLTTWIPVRLHSIPLPSTSGSLTTNRTIAKRLRQDCDKLRPGGRSSSIPYP